jgi:hypothetical protein
MQLHLSRERTPLDDMEQLKNAVFCCSYQLRMYQHLHRICRINDRLRILRIQLDRLRIQFGLIWGIMMQDANDEFWLATTSEVKDRTGQYFVSRQPSRLGLPAQNPADRARLWDILAQQSGLTSSEGTHL